MLVRFTLLTFLVLLFTYMPAFAFNSGYLEFSLPAHNSSRTINIACWYPTNQNEEAFKYNTVIRAGLVAFNAAPAIGSERFPVLIHSHGYSGGALVATDICEQFSRHGYIVLSPDHADDFLLHPIVGDGMGMKMFAELFSKSSELYKKREKFNPADHTHRISDLRQIIDFICTTTDTNSLELAVVLNRADLDRIGLVGHSLGAYSCLSVVGANDQAADPRIKCVLAWSPAIWMWNGEDYQKFKVPVMIQYGKLEPGPRLGNSNGIMDRAFENVLGPKYLAEVARAGHFAWIDGMPDSLFIKSDAFAEINNAIMSLSFDFLDAYLREIPAAKQRLADVSINREGLSKYLTGNLW